MVDALKQMQGPSLAAVDGGLSRFAERVDQIAAGPLLLRRHHPRSPPAAKIRPGAPAPRTGPGTGDALPGKGANPSGIPSSAEMKPLYDPETELSAGLKLPLPVAEPVSPGSNPPVIRKEIETADGEPLPENVPVSSPFENSQSNVPPVKMMFDGLLESTLALSDPVNAPKVMSLPLPVNVSVNTVPLPPDPVPEKVPEIGIVLA